MNDSPAPDPTGPAGRAERDYLTYARSFGRVPGISILDDGERPRILGSTTCCC